MPQARSTSVPRFVATAVIAIGLLGRAVGAAEADPAAPVEYRTQVWPIIKEKCLQCHNPDIRQGALDMSTRAAMLKGGDSGAAFTPGDVDKSLMIELIEFDEMPPRKQKERRVTKAELQTLSTWIDQGAVVPEEPPPAAP